jgi:mRNA-degrading endonuclease RelE of RelBE toxin-antitoxin system
MSTPHTSPDEYHPTSPVLILGICSLSKRKDVETDTPTPYQSNTSIAARLKHKPAVDRLFQGRKEGFELIRESNIENNGALLRDHPYNVALKGAPDFRGAARARYLPAIDRYIGRFYRPTNDQGETLVLRDKVLQSPHHLLIISGLYGLLLPNEQIQVYESPLEDVQQIRDVWIKDERLTYILAAYILAQGVRLVIDMTGQRAYQEMINWTKIRALPNVRVLHAMSKLGPGPDQLRSFGLLLYDRFLETPSEGLLSLPSNHEFPATDVMLRETSAPPKEQSWPREPTELEAALVEMRIGLARFEQTTEQDFATLFGRDQGKALIEQARRQGSPWHVSMNPRLPADIDKFDDPGVKKLLLEHMVQLLTTFPVPRRWENVLKLQRIGGYQGWRLRFGHYRLQFYTDEGERQLYLHSFDRRRETGETYDFSQVKASKIREYFLRTEE